MRRPRVALIIESSLAYGRGLLRGIAKYLKEHGPWSIFLELGEAPLRTWDGDGVLTRRRDPGPLRRGIPVVGLYDHSPERRGRAMVLNDNTAVGAAAARHLLDRGYRELAFFGPRGDWWAELRRKGARIAESASHAPRGGTWEVQQEALAAWLRRRPKPLGLVAANDLHGFRALEACRRAGLAVPEEVAVVGADEDPELCELSEPPLSSVRFDAEGAGYAAAALLDRLMRGRTGPRAPIRVPPLGVTARQSTDMLAIDDPAVARAIHEIRRRAFEGVKVGDLVSALPLSRRALEHRFRRLLGRTPKEEIQRLRLERAKDLLSTTKLPVERIAERLGYHQAAYFSAAFRRETGASPGRWRRRQGPRR